MRAVAIVALSLLAGVLGAPSMSNRAEDWKIELGWDGKKMTPAQLDPSNTNKTTLAKAAALSGGVYFCTDSDWKGNCIWVYGLGEYQCINLGDDYNDKVSSFGPDPGVQCALYSNYDCKGWALRGGGYVVNPGFKNLETAGFNDVMSSFMCAAEYRP